jgi:flagellar motility protein MotE (MotC chaperone)
MFRVLPYLIICLVVFAITKLLDVVSDSGSFFMINELRAEGQESKEGEGGAEAKPESEAGHGGEGNSEGQQQKAAEEKKEQEPPCPFSPTEIEVLKGLQKRRQELDKREQEIALKEGTLSVIEKNITAKIESLEKLQSELKTIMAKYEEKQNQEIQALVKIYENMKPKDAARIFDTLELEVLLGVTSNMKEVKLAPIIAAMDPNRAKILTVELANKNKINLKDYNW